MLWDQAMSVIATNSFGCSDTAATLVLSHLEIEYTASQTDESCFGLNDGNGVVNITGGSNPIAIYWISLASGSSMADSLAPNMYVFTLTDSVS